MVCSGGARLLPAQIAVLRIRGEPDLPEPPGELLRDRHTAVLSAGAADGHGEVPLALPFKPRGGGVNQAHEGLNERGRSPLTENVATDLRLTAGQLAEIGNPVRIRQKA